MGAGPGLSRRANLDRPHRFAGKGEAEGLSALLATMVVPALPSGRHSTLVTTRSAVSKALQNEDLLLGTAIAQEKGGANVGRNAYNYSFMAVVEFSGS